MRMLSILFILLTLCSCGSRDMVGPPQGGTGLFKVSNGDVFLNGTCGYMVVKDIDDAKKICSGDGSENKFESCEEAIAHIKGRYPGMNCMHPTTGTLMTSAFATTLESGIVSGAVEIMECGDDVIYDYDNVAGICSNQSSDSEIDECNNEVFKFLAKYPDMECRYKALDLTINGAHLNSLIRILI